jgi:hypothetical protein
MLVNRDINENDYEILLQLEKYLAKIWFYLFEVSFF